MTLRSELTEQERERLRARDRRADKRRKQGMPGQVTAAEFEAARRLLLKAREHGMDDVKIARQVGVPGDNTIWKIRTGAISTCLRTTYDRVMTLKPEETVSRPHPVKGKVPDGPPVDAVGTQRRIRALRADGFPNGLLADRLGVTPEAVSELARRPRAYVYHTTYAEVRELYDKLSDVSPADLGVSHAAQLRAKASAVKNGWVSRSCWDTGTIDDPDALPDWTGLCGTPVGRLAHKRDGTTPCDRCKSAPRARFSGARLRAVRERGGWTQNDLSEAAGLSRGHVHHWESGRYAPRLDALCRLLEILDVTFEEVYESEES